MGNEDSGARFCDKIGGKCFFLSLGWRDSLVEILSERDDLSFSGNGDGQLHLVMGDSYGRGQGDGLLRNTEIVWNHEVCCKSFCVLLPSFYSWTIH